MPCNGGPWSDSRPCEGGCRESVRHEKAACAARWLALQLAARGAVPSGLRKAVAAARAEQLEHRRADRADVVRKIDARLDALARQEARIRELGGEPGGGLGRQRAKWRAVRKGLLARTDAELLETYFGNEPRFHDLDSEVDDGE